MGQSRWATKKTKGKQDGIQTLYRQEIINEMLSAPAMWNSKTYIKSIRALIKKKKVTKECKCTNADI
jgi:hypothetical protein